MSFEVFNIVRGLHILAVIAWMAGMLFLPRLYAYDAEQADRPEPLRSEMRGLLREWQRRLLKIIVNPAMTAAWVFGVWMIVKLLGVIGLSGWHGFLAGELKRIHAGISVKSGRFWRMTNEIPFLIAVVIVLAVTMEWSFGGT